MKKNKQMFWFNFRIISIIAFFMGGFLILLIVSCVFKSNWIICGGSTSVAPILTKVNKFYHKSDSNKSDFLYNALGSNAAAGGINLNTYALGFESKKVPYSKQYLRFKIAKDYVLILFHLPDKVSFKNKDISKNPDLKYGLEIQQNDNKIKILQDIYQQQTISWKQLFNDKNVKSQLVTKKSTTNLNQKITTYTREAGSGTRSYFENNILKTSSNNANVVTSNGAMINAIESTKSSVGFLSFSFIYKVRDDIKNKHLNLAILATNFLNNDTFELPFSDKESFLTSKSIDFNKNYGFNRPFVGLLNRKIITEKKKFLLCLRYVFALLYKPSKTEIGNQSPYAKIYHIETNLGFQKLNFKEQNQGCDFTELKQLFHENSLDIHNKPNWLG